MPRLMNARNAMAASATLHCLTGCAIGEILGLVVGTAAGLSNAVTIALSIALAFVFGYLLSTLPLVQSGIAFAAALKVVLAADTLSILTMEVVDNAVMAIVPGAMDAGLVNPVFWLSMMLALSAAFVVAFPVNRALLEAGLVVQAVVGIAQVVGGSGDPTVTFVGYLLAVLVVLPLGLLWSLGERSRGATAVLIVALVTVAFLVLRLVQIHADA